LLLAGWFVVVAYFCARGAGRPADSLVPVFMLEYVPVGMRGLMLAGLLAAAMSSIDSAMNSLAAVTMEDVLRKDPDTTPVRWGRMVSVCWGLFSVGSAMLFARGGSGVLETINLIGSAFYGPILAVFLLGVLTRGVTGRGAIAGLLAGLVGNLLLARLAPGISWLWWNPAGFLVACAVALMLSPRPIGWVRPSWRGSGARVLLPAFVIILVLLAAAPRLIAAIAGH
jgi:SSS family solute:Na+ symporter